MKRSISSLAAVLALAAIVAIPAYAAAPTATKTVVETANGVTTLLIKISSDQAVYGINVSTAANSIKDIYVPEGWVGIASDSEILFRTDTKPIRGGSTATFRVMTANEDASMSLIYRNQEKKIGEGSL